MKTQQAAVITLKHEDFPAHCPNPRMPVWSSHPKVFLDLSHAGEATCPYCGTRYQTEDGKPHAGGH